MGLPELTFSLKKAADNVATRVSSGIVAMILRDAKANGLHTINRESDIPSELGAANIAAIKRAMLGYITKPTTLYVSVIGADADIKTGFQALAIHSYDYLVGPVDIASADATALAAQVKAQRTKRYVGKVMALKIPGRKPHSAPAATEATIIMTMRRPLGILPPRQIMQAAVARQPMST